MHHFVRGSVATSVIQRTNDLIKGRIHDSPAHRQTDRQQHVVETGERRGHPRIEESLIQYAGRGVGRSQWNQKRRWKKRIRLQAWLHSPSSPPHLTLHRQGSLSVQANRQARCVKFHFTTCQACMLVSGGQHRAWLSHHSEQPGIYQVLSACRPSDTRDETSSGRVELHQQTNEEAHSSLCYKHHTATGTHVPYGITQQRWLSRLYPSQLRLVLDLATPEGCKAELT